MTSNPIKILLVDDEVRNLDALESFLESPAYTLVRVTSGDAALLHLLEGEFAAIVLDVQMPGMSGIELANLIKQRKRTQHIPIIFLTAYFQEDKDVLQGYSMGAVDYLTKPVNPQILKSKIDVFVELFRTARALAETNATLEQEIAQRQKAEEELRQANNELEARVAARTSELVKVNEELIQREKLLLESEAKAMAGSRAKDDFLAALSHELRTPLNPVLLLATEASHNEEIPAHIRADFETIARNVALEARLIDDMLDLTRIERGKLSLDLRPVDLHLIVEHAVAMARPDIEQKHIDVILDLAATQRTVNGDDVRLKQVFWNVVKNAGKFTAPHGKITIRSRSTDGGMIVVSVADTGIGMSRDELGRIFEAFSQGDHAGSGSPHQFGGLGLGLAICRMMVTLHSGTIEAHSEGVGKGTTIVITLPLLDTHALTEASSGSADGFGASAARNPAGKPYRILVVEDHAPTSRALVQLLTRRKYEVVACTTVADAEAAARDTPFDAIISDIGLPDGNGYDLMRRIKGLKDIPGIALTGYGMEEDIAKSREAGFGAHLTKPISVQALDRALHGLRSAGSASPLG